MPPITLEDLNLEAAERRLCNEALGLAGNIVGAAKLLGITRHALKRRIVKLGLDRPRAHAAADSPAPRPSAPSIAPGQPQRRPEV